MSKSKAATPPLHILRGIFRLLKTPSLSRELVSKAAAKGVDISARHRANAQTAHLVSEYRKAAAVAAASDDTTSRRLQQKMAVDYFRLLRDLKERADLQFLDRGADQVFSPQEMSRRAAARAGLQLPELDDTIEGR